MQDLYSGNLIQSKFGNTFQIIKSADSGYICNAKNLETGWVSQTQHLIHFDNIEKVIPTCHQCGSLIDENTSHPTFGTKHFCDRNCEAEYAL